MTPTSVSYDLRDNHGKTLYVENAIEQVNIIHLVHNDHFDQTCFIIVIILLNYFSLTSINSLKVEKKLLLPKSWQDLVNKIDERRTNSDEDTDEFRSPE